MAALPEGVRFVRPVGDVLLVPGLFLATFFLLPALALVTLTWVYLVTEEKQLTPGRRRSEGGAGSRSIARRLRTHECALLSSCRRETRRNGEAAPCA